MKKTLFIIATIFILKLNAQTFVKIPDANFVTYLQSIVPSAMHTDSLNTSSSLVTTSTYTINVQGKNISDLTGVQYFTSLTYLKCQDNSLTSIPTLPNSITYFNCGHNSLTNLPVLPNSLLTLICDTNQLTSLPTLPSTLTSIRCWNNQISSLPTLPNSLQSLGCVYNNLTTLPSLPSQLYFLNATANYLTSLPSLLPNALVYLELSGNNLTSLPTLPNSLQYLYCQYNNLTSLPSLPNSIQYLYINNNNLTSLPTLPSNLKTFYIENNNIACFPTFPHSITTLYLDPNPYNCLPNYISAMGTDTVTYPKCAAGNTNSCAVATGIKQLTINNIQLAIYPNPASDQFFIDAGTTDKLTVDLYDVNGRHVFSAIVNDKSNINVATLDNGAYTLTIKTADSVINKKVVILR